MKSILLFLISLLFVSSLFSQNTVLLMNGKELKINSDLVAEDDIYYMYLNNKGKTKRVEIDNVFSMIDTTGKEFVLYDPNLDEDNYSVENMRYFMYGARDARNEYVAPWFTVGGFAVGAGAPFLLGYYSPVVPAAFSTGVGLVPNNSYMISNNSPYRSNEFYGEGYKEIVKNKRVKNSLIGGGFGIAFGVAAVLIMNYQFH